MATQADVMQELAQIAAPGGRSLVEADLVRALTVTGDEVRFVLVHGGYPFNTEAGYITSVYPNVFLDFSLMIPWSSIGIADRIWQTLESAPTTKLMYGSDGIMVPELFWISAHNARRALGKVLDRLIEDDIVDEAEAESIGHDILHRTAGRVYGVKEAAGDGA